MKKLLTICLMGSILSCGEKDSDNKTSPKTSVYFLESSKLGLESDIGYCHQDFMIDYDTVLRNLSYVEANKENPSGPNFCFVALEAIRFINVLQADHGGVTCRFEGEDIGGYDFYDNLAELQHSQIVKNCQ